MASEMPAAMRPYSMAVAPDSSFTKRAIRFFIGVTPCVHVAGRTNCGLAGVLSTVTMASPYGRTIAGGLIRSSKHRDNSLFLSRVNLALRHCIKLKRDAVALISVINETAAKPRDFRFTAP